jgi:hypothetical protein
MILQFQMYLVVIFIIILLGVFVVGWFFSKKAKVKRMLKKTPAMRIGEFLGGEAGRVTGQVRFAGETLTSPLSGRKCAFYHVEVQEYRSSGKSGHWYTIVNEEKAGDIIMHDGTNYCMIGKGQLKSYLHMDANYNSGTFKDATPELESYLISRGYKSTGLLGFNKSIRYKEGILEENEVFTAAGTGTWTTGRPANVNLPGSRYLLLGPMPDGFIYLTDDQKMVG